MTDHEMTVLAWVILGVGFAVAIAVQIATMIFDGWFSAIRDLLKPAPMPGRRIPSEQQQSQSTPLDGNPPGAERPEGRQPARYWLE